MPRITKNDILIKFISAVDAAFPELAPVILACHEPENAEHFGRTGFNFMTGTGLRRLWWFVTIKGEWVTLSVYSKWNGSRTCINDWWSSVCIHYTGNFNRALLALQGHAEIGQMLGLGVDTQYRVARKELR